MLVFVATPSTGCGPAEFAEIYVQLSQRTDYALRLMMHLALSRQSVVPTAEIAEAFAVSKHHLDKVAQDLAHGGFIETLRGRGGGLRLARAPDEISVGSIVRQLESMSLVECMNSERNACVLTPGCKLAGVLDDALEAFLKVLDAWSLADLVIRPNPLRRLLAIA
jgi:Rrf2 family transcriptional regulator, nitric oxide-sensitive transcriptional repressor